MSDLENKRGKFQGAVEREIEKGKNGSVREIEEEWKHLRNAITVGAEVVYGFWKARAAQKPWIASEILNKMDERRNWKVLIQAWTQGIFSIE